MDLTPHVAALRDDLAAAAAVGDEATSRAGSTLAAALEPAMRLALMNALSELATEIDGALDDRSVSLRLRGREVDVVVSDADRGGEPAPAGFFAGPSSSPFADPGRSERPRPGGTPGPGGPFGGGDPWGAGSDVGDISRMTLRIVDQIKGQAERAAASQGMSLNSWVSQAVQGALRGQGGWPGGARGPWAGGSPGGSPSGDAPADPDPRPGPDPSGPGASGPTGAPGGEGQRPGAEPGRRRPDEGDGGVQGWVRG